ncbi:cbb3-type cytochrome c oxidase N-terminal domain-containing protein [Fodinibius saliphilus]|uniref:cbb3-type cytochrome c oxidase N-terminal domain-containing protein n=1 Tax=Fodinibius saliphilus TaxID=1920650 RepID=UPI001107CFFC|nr:cbb3-type cytochrome c oxidase N-terminal domain-containing protein [Fodinibius saliphilus]
MEVYEGEKDKLLDHEYDGIRELDNHMPFWWLWLFFITIAISVFYLLFYQVLGWGQTQIEEYEQEIAEAEAKFGGSEEQEPAASFTWQISEEEADIQAGKQMFNGSQLCYTCHGKEGQGMVGPNLTDNQWIHGCSPKEIAQSIIEGFPQKGMLAYGSGSKISNEKVQQIVSYMATLQGTEPADAKAADPNRAEPCTEGPFASSD